MTLILVRSANVTFPYNWYITMCLDLLTMESPLTKQLDPLYYTHYPILYISTGCPSTGPSTPTAQCREAYLEGCRQDGVYTIDPGCGKPFNVFCDMKNGGWTVFQRRRDGSENFYRGWTDYVAGFGNLKREFWLGLDHIHCLTSAVLKTELRIDLADFYGNSRHVQYNFFYVNGANTNYILGVGFYNSTSTVQDRLILNNGMQFSTKDRDNDQYSGNCASDSSYQGAWWYKGCTYSNLNGRYRSGVSSWGTMRWVTLGYGAVDAMRFTEMKLRSRD